ncbi:MAG TPA: N-acetylmuramoyl-L-alanine amidase [Nitrospirae bacterium]|nr:N-acetylmuramoyl-L-alanine amidase AmiC precursor [bacterium BMS3Abin08]HDO36720.1 N-acetylmuramoyl-L-alanine amidase [Nitrospirota bacterium]HDY71529.1 N-acetylmuramoyl-L-alanine amidase [Nitrospirota bacterium]
MLKPDEESTFMKRKTLVNLTALFTVFLLFLSYADILLAGEISLRYSLKGNVLKIVFESDDENLLKKATISSSYSLIKIGFPEDFSFTAPNKIGAFEYNKKENNIFLNIKGLMNVKVLRLESPSRLVLDVYLEGKSKPEIKPETPATAPIIPGPPEEPFVGELKSIVIDPGHGGSDVGLYSPLYNEKSIALKVAKRLRNASKREKRKAYLTRYQDSDTSLKKRILTIRKKRPDLVISIHLSTSDHFVIYTVPEKTYQGELPYLLSASQLPYVARSRAISSAIASTLTKDLNIEVSHRDLPLPVLSYSNCRAFMIELPGPDFFEYTEKSIQKIVRAILEGIKAYEKG